MRRLQIYLPEETYQELRKEAFEKNTSIAEIMRKKVSKKTIKRKATKGIKENPFDGLIKFAKRAEKEGWKGHTRRIDEEMLREKLENPAENYYFIAGGTQMALDIAKCVKKIGALPERVKFEGYG